MPFDPDLVDPGDAEFKLSRGGLRAPGGPGGPGPSGGFVGSAGGGFYGSGGSAYNPVSGYGARKRRMGGLPGGGSFATVLADPPPALAKMGGAPALSVTGAPMQGALGAIPLAASRPIEDSPPAPAPAPKPAATPVGGPTSTGPPAATAVRAPDYAAILKLPSAGGMAAAARQWAAANGLGGVIGGWAEKDGWDTVNRNLVEMIKNGTLHTELASRQSAAANGQLGGADRNDPVGVVMRILQDAIKNGTLSPNGSPARQEQLRGEANRNANAVRSRTELRGQLSGADAGSEGTASLLADLEGSRAGSDLLNASSRDQQDRYASLVSGLLGASYGHQAGQDDQRFTSELQRILTEQARNGTGLNDLIGLIGSLGGAALGSLGGGSPAPAPAPARP